MSTATVEREHWTEADMKARYGYSPKTLQRLRKNDGLPSFKAAHGPRLYPIAAVLKWESARISALAPAKAEAVPEPETAKRRNGPRRVAGAARAFGRDGRKGA